MVADPVTLAQRTAAAMEIGARYCAGGIAGWDLRQAVQHLMHEQPIAWRFNGEDRCDWPGWLREYPGIHEFRRPNGTVEYLTFDNPRMVCHQGNWIIRNGEDVIVCLPDPLLAEAEQGLI